MTYTIRKRRRVEASPKYGLRQAWTEFQVLQGRKIVARRDTLGQAQTWIREQLEDEARAKARGPAS